MAALRRPVPRVADAHNGLSHLGESNGNALLSLEARDAAWFSRLARSRSARALQDHLACMEDRLNSRGREGSIKEAVNNRETFLSALHKCCANGTSFPCGLPETLPLYVAIVNLSGQRMMLTSDEDTLMRKLCGHSWSLHPDCLAEQLAQVAHHVNSKMAEHAVSKTPIITEFVLITYSLPWQAGISSAYWELNTVRVITSETGQRSVRDRDLSFSSMSTCLFEDARPTLCSCAPGSGIPMVIGHSSERTLRFVPDDQINAFVNGYRAVDLDAPAHTSTSDEAERVVGSATTPKMAKLQSILADLQLGRKKDQDEIGILKAAEKQLKLDHATALAEENTKAMASIEKAEKREKIADEKVEANAKEINTLRLNNIALLTEIDEALGAKLDIQKRMDKLTKQELSKDKLHNAYSSKQTAEIKKLTDRLAAQERSAAQQIAELNKAHSHAIEQLETKAETKRLTLQETLSWKEKVCNQLVENNDGKLAELEDARERLAESRARIFELGAENMQLREQCQQAERDAHQSVACETHSQGTSTHHHNGTQTGNGCIMADDLPEELRANLPAPPSWAQSTPAPAVPTQTPPTVAPSTVAPSPTPSPTPSPVLAPAAFQGADAMVQPFGTPQMAMNAAMSSLGHLLGWTQFLEAQAIQHNASTHFAPQPFTPQPFTPPPHRQRR